jgi:hypothetical protein
MKSHLLSSHAVKRQPRNFNQNKRFVFAHMPIPNEHITHTHTHRGDYFRFGSVFIKKRKPNQKFFFLKKTETEPKPVQTGWFRFGFLGQKQVQTCLARFFPVLLGFFPVWVRFGFFGLAQVGSGFFRFRFGSVFGL